MKLSKYFCPWCEGVRLEFREVSGSAPNGNGSAQLHGINLSCSLAQVTGCPDATGACATEEEAERYAAEQCKLHPAPKGEAQGGCADRFEEWAQGASPKLLAALTTPAPRLPIYMFAVEGVFPGEFSVEAEDEKVARAALWVQMSDAQRDACAGFDAIEVYLPESRAPEMQPMGIKEFQALYMDWQNDPCYDLKDVARYPQHEDVLRGVQERKEAEWAQEREARDKLDRAALQERADKAGVSVEVMALIEAQQAQIKRLEAALNILVEAKDFDKGSFACYQALRTGSKV